MLRSLLLTGVFTAAAWTAPITFTFGGSGVMADGEALTSTISGLTVTVTAWSTTGNGGGAGGTLQTARIGRYGTNGLGICNDNEASNCTSPEHTVDNNGASDFMLFVFSTPVDLLSLGITSWGDTDITYFTGVSGFAGPLGYTVANINGLGSGWTRQSDIVNAPALPSTAALAGTNVTALLLGARTPDVVCSQPSSSCNVDRFKIRTLTVEVPQGEEEIPEPATMFLTGGGLVAAALIRRRTRK